MRRKLPFLLFILALMANQARSQSNQEKQVVKAVEKLRRAMVEGDRQALETIADEKLSYGHSSGLVENKSEFVEKIVTGKSDFVAIDLSDQVITVSGKTAIVRHILNASTNDGGVAGTVKIKVLLVFQKSQTGWKLLARQAVKLT